MNKFINKNWHVYLVIAAILIISALSWGSFAKTVINETMLENSQADNEITTNGKEINSSEDGFTYIYELLNGPIEKVNNSWKVFKQSFFSSIDTFTTYFVTGEISSLQVIGGKKGWLFYGSKIDGDSIGDFEGTNYLSDAEMEAMYDTAISAQNEMENRGIKFVILVPPNKENVYAEYMTEAYLHCEKSRTDILVDYLSEKGANIISPKQELLQEHLDYQLYYSYDTHWNQLGAYIGVKSTLKFWGYDLPDFSERNIICKDLNNEYHYGASDDLAQLTGMRFVFFNEKEYIIDGTLPVDWSEFEKEQNETGISYFYNENASIDAKIAIFGDSFRISTVPSLGEQFSEVYVAERSNFTAAVIDEINPDYVILEFVERYSDAIKNVDCGFQ